VVNTNSLDYSIFYFLWFIFNFLCKWHKFS